MITAIAILGCSFAVTLGATVLTRRWAPALGLVAAHPHPGPQGRTVPTGGGVGIILGIFSVPAFALAMGAPALSSMSSPVTVLLAATLAMVVIGLWDDAFRLTPLKKLSLQSGVATAAFFAGVRLTEVTIPAMGTVTLVPALALFATVVWLVAVTNALNLSDGADGVAVGIALVACTALLVHAVAAGRADLSTVLLSSIAALAAFLWFNFPPASVIMGDAGSLSLGFLLGGLVVVGGPQSHGGLGLVAGAVVLGVPLFDTSLSIVRRLLAGTAITRADRGHIHDLLAARGLPPRWVAIGLYLASFAFALAGLVIAGTSSQVLGLAIIAIVCAAVSFGVTWLRVPEFAGRSAPDSRRRIPAHWDKRITGEAELLRASSEIEEVQVRLTNSSLVGIAPLTDDFLAAVGGAVPTPHRSGAPADQRERDVG